LSSGNLEKEMRLLFGSKLRAEGGDGSLNLERYNIWVLFLSNFVDVIIMQLFGVSAGENRTESAGLLRSGGN
jgi:hypothetical protein